VHGAYAQVVTASQRLPPGVNLVWSTLQSEAATRRMTIAARGGNRVLDLFSSDPAAEYQATIHQLNPARTELNPWQLTSIAEYNEAFMFMIALESDDGSLPRSVYAVAASPDRAVRSRWSVTLAPPESGV